MEKFELFRHPHPLVFIEEGTNSHEVRLCSSCNKPLYPPALTCPLCNFHLHQVCAELPAQIHSSFHPQHSLSLEKFNCDKCHCCLQKPVDYIYTCSPCNFIIDIKCALADTKASGLSQVADNEFQHFCHNHPLILVQEEESGREEEVVCHLCELLIEPGPTYFCSLCDIRFHKGCAELPREMSNPDRHPHPLFLFPQPQHTTESFCGTCKNRCTWFVYSCLQCNFHLHVTCLSSSDHKHKFTKLRNQLSFRCLLCGLWRYDFPWFCSICHLLAHKECAASPLSLRVVGHYHSSLNLTCNLPRVDDPSKLACEICREKIDVQFPAYCCSTSACNYVAHLNCARTKMTGEVGNSLLNDIGLKDEVLDIEILHSNRQHELSLCNEEDGYDKYCNGCMRRISAPSYSCANCDFFLHKICAASPITKHHLLHEHPLTLITTPDVVFQCDACLQFFHGYAYHCEDKACRFTLDIRCAHIPTKQFKHPSHQHFLSLAQNNEDQRCRGCGRSSNTVFRCDDGCNFSLDYRCATLPLAVRYRFDIHSLNLTFSAEDETGEYYCDVCEEERDPSVWFYYCEMCRFAAHPACVLGEYPWLKSGLYEAHRHPLTLVKEGKMNYPKCGHCGDFCAGNLAYECRRCKFNVHAIGHCYHKQILKGKIIFKK